jgi:transcription elongation factor SPT5
LDFLSRKAEVANDQDLPWAFGTAFSRPSVPGVVYIECEDPQDIRRIFQHVHTVYTTRPVTLVSPDEHIQLVNMPTVEHPLPEGTWVRIKRGKYEGNIGYVTTPMMSNSAGVLLLLVPRVHYQEGPVWTRPPQELFRVDLARSVFGAHKVVQLGSDTFFFQEKKFRGGLFLRFWSREALQVEGAFPLFEEIELFSQSPVFDARARLKWESDVVAAALRVDDRVEITGGELEGTVGRITKKVNDSVEMQPLAHRLGQRPFDEHFRVALLPSQVRRVFKIGDYIQVRCGNHAGKYGYIVNLPTDRTLEFVEWDKSVPHSPVWQFTSRCSMSPA